MRKHSFTIISGDRQTGVANALTSRGFAQDCAVRDGAVAAVQRKVTMPSLSWDGYCALALMPVQLCETGTDDPAPFRIACSTPLEAVGWTVFGVRSPASLAGFSRDESDLVVLRDCGRLSSAVTELLSMMRESGLPAYYRDGATPWIWLPMCDESDIAGSVAK